MAFATLCTICTKGYAKPQEQQGADTPTTPSTEEPDKDPRNDKTTKQTDDSYESVIDNKNSLGATFLKNLIIDQKVIWTSPSHLRFGDMNWLVPVGAIAAGSLMADTGISKSLSDRWPVNLSTKA